MWSVASVLVFEVWKSTSKWLGWNCWGTIGESCSAELQDIQTQTEITGMCDSPALQSGLYLGVEEYTAGGRDHDPTCA